MKVPAMRIGGRQFFLRPIAGVATVVFIAITVSLGNWQRHRAEEKLEAAQKADEAAQGAMLSIPPALVSADGFEHRRVGVRGRFTARSTIFIDNKVLGGVAGYHVLTPLAIEGGDMHVLVDRGWVAAGDRSRLPIVPTPEDLQTIEGIAVLPSRRFVELAPEAESGPLRQNLVLELEKKRLGLDLQPFVIEQTSESQDGLIRAWARPDAGAARNQSYALQWYSFATLAAIIYVVLGFKRTVPHPGH